VALETAFMTLPRVPVGSLSADWLAARGPGVGLLGREVIRRERF